VQYFLSSKDEKHKDKPHFADKNPHVVQLGPSTTLIQKNSLKSLGEFE